MPAAPPDERVRMAGDAVRSIVDRCRSAGHPPALALIEMPDYLASWATPTSIVLYFRSVGVAEYAAHLCGLPIGYVKASRYKEKTRKADALERFRQAVGRHPQTDDESDAFCIGWDYLVELAAKQPPPAEHGLNEADFGWEDVGDVDPGPY